MKSNAKREIVYVSTERLKPFDGNPRDNDDAVPKVRRSIETFGFINPIIVDKKYRICAGHTRYKAALEMGLTEVPVIIVPDLIGKKFEAFNITDNKTGEIAEWNDDKLGALIKDLSESDFDTSVLGYTDGEISQILKRIENKMAGADPDDVPEPPKKAVTKPGDLWILGEHRLLCGDATNVNDIDRLMIGGVADICITSPPYFNQRPEYSTWKSYDDYLKFISDIIKTMPMARNAVVGINIGSDEQAHRWMPADWWCALRDNGWKYQESFAWVKAAAVWSVPRSMHIENGHYFPAQRWEIILTVSRGKHPKFDISDRDRIRAFQDNVWQMPVVVGSAQKAIGHPAMFPVELPNRFVTAYSQIAAIVYEPFAGSGTTIIACEQLNRRCFAMEIDPIYCDVSVKRWETFTGKKAVLQK